MKLKTISLLLSFVGALALSAETQTTEQTTERQNSDGTVTRTETKTTTFTPEIRTQVVKYFDPYKSAQYGLPPEYVTRVKVKEVPVAWRTTIAPGVMIDEKSRPYLYAAPPELIKVLPVPTAGVHYYVAGSNVVAVDAQYRVVDSVQIPSVRITD